MSEPGKGFTLGPAALADARNLLVPIAALQLLADDITGSTPVLSVSEHLKQKIMSVHAVVDISGRLLGNDPLLEHNSR
jgi:hypothetical protein